MPATCTQACAFFVTRAKKNLQFYLRTSRPVDRSSGLRCDQTIRLTGIRMAQRYPDTFRRIVYFDVEKERVAMQRYAPRWRILNPKDAVAVARLGR